MLLLLFLLATPTVAAQGLSVDSQLLHPSLAEDGIAGLNAAPYAMEGWVLGGTVQVELTPVRLHPVNASPVPLIDLRASAAPVLAYQGGRWRVSLAVPFGQNLSSSQTPLSHDGSFRGDPILSAEMRLTPGPDKDPRLRIGLRGSLYVPMGTPRAWYGEAFGRQALSLNLLVPLDSVSAGVEAGWQQRTPQEEVYSYEARSELFLRFGAAVPVGEFIALSGTVMVETAPQAQGWEESAVEVLFGIQMQDKGNTIGVGRGLTPGLGTSQGRLFFNGPGIELDEMGFLGRKRKTKTEELTVPPPPKPQTEYTVSRSVGMGGSSTTLLSDVPPPPLVSSNGLAQVVDDRIVIREPIQFEVGTDQILPASLPVLEAVAELMGQHPEIAHLAIVGHASEEGEHQPNYELSTQRARSVYEQLLLNGVHPKRLSFRGMGEVEPISEELAENRRVEFQIVNQLHPLDDPEALPEESPLPWNGELVPITQPPPPELPEEIEPTRPEIDPSTFDQEAP